MCSTMCPKRSFIRIALFTVVLILLTRVITLTYNRQLHPDEHVFYASVHSLSQSILESDTPFVENKEYPEGTYIFQLPFQLAGQIFRNAIGIGGTKGIQQIGRLASVFYFVIAVLLGLRLLWRYLGKSRVSLWIYGLTMTFSLFFIEQSRYGTGDIITLMLVMLLINLTAQAMESDSKNKWWAAAFFVSGVLGSIKYPLLVFTLIPLTAFLSRPGSRKVRRMALFLAAIAAGFFLFSPKTLMDPGYILRVIDREGSAYGFSRADSLIPVRNLVNLGLYLLLYSDFPLLPPVVLGGFVWHFVSRIPSRSATAQKPDSALLFEYIVPGVCLFFFVYNLFVAVQFFRTYTPFFGMATLYTAAAADSLFSKNKWSKAAVLFLAVCMILRGMAFVWVLSDEGKIQEKLSAIVSGAVDENWKETWYTCLFSFRVAEDADVTVHDHHFVEPLVEHNGGYALQPGQLVVTGAQAFYLGQPHLVGNATANVITWSAFTEANRDYYVGQLYPDFCYYLFGGWIRGSTLSQYELPCHHIYYRGQ